MGRRPKIKPVPGQRSEKKIGNVVYMTINPAAEYLGVCKNTVRSYCLPGKDGKPMLSHLKLGSNFFFQKKWLKHFLNERTFIGLGGDGNGEEYGGKEGEE